MKLESLFRAENKKLVRISDDREYQAVNCPVKEAATCLGEAKAKDVTDEFFAVNVPWSLVGFDEDNYNEQFLSDFRDFLKVLDEKKVYVYINPVVDKEISCDAQKEELTSSFKHCARRIKDCQCVVGFTIPDGADPVYFMEELSAKHAQYVYFSKDLSLENEKIVLI